MPYLNSRPRTPGVCPVCGEDVPPRTLACPGCGADHHSGWRTGALDADGLPDDDFDYDQFVKEEFRGDGSSGKSRLHPVWWITAVVVLISLAAAYLLGIFQV